MNLWQIRFSPTGGTQRVANAVCNGIGSAVNECELCAPESELATVELTEGDVAVVAMPVYGGRIPALATERLKTNIKTNGAFCAVVAVYGNRAYDDALLELHKTCTDMGFKVIAAVGAVAEHSIIRKYGAERPDADDLNDLQSFGEKIKDAIEKGVVLPESALNGNYPYKKPMAGPNPTGGKKCTDCGKCASQCPVGAIPSENLRSVDKKRCISCMRCVSVCPNGARSIGKLMHCMIAMAIKKGCAERKQNELFIP